MNNLQKYYSKAGLPVPTDLPPCAQCQGAVWTVEQISRKVMVCCQCLTLGVLTVCTDTVTADSLAQKARLRRIKVCSQQIPMEEEQE